VFDAEKFQLSFGII